MDLRNPTEHLTEALARAQKHWLERHAGAANDSMPDDFTVAFSREAGTPGAVIARKAAERLGWPVYDHELVQRIANDLGVRRALLESVDERHIDWVSESLSGLLEVPQVSSTAYFRQLLETVLSLATHGKCVIVGRGATCILPPGTTLRVRIVAPLDDRIQAVRRDHGCTEADASATVRRTDEERNRFIRDHFQCDPEDPSNYDLVLNTASFSTEEAADIVLAALDRRQQRRKSPPRPSSRQNAAIVGS